MLERNPSKFSQIESPSNFPQSSDKTEADGFRERNEGSTASLLEMEIWTNFSNLKHCVTHRRFRSSVKYDQEINLTWFNSLLLTPSDHEEADTRLFLHVIDMANTYDDTDCRYRCVDTIHIVIWWSQTPWALDWFRIRKAVLLPPHTWDDLGSSKQTGLRFYTPNMWGLVPVHQKIVVATYGEVPFLLKSTCHHSNCIDGIRTTLLIIGRTCVDWGSW